jgi:transposase
MTKHQKITLTDEQRQELEGLIHAGTAPARTQTRVRILLLSDTNKGKPLSEKRIATSLMCSTQTVHNVRHRLIENDLATALYDQPRPGQAPKFTGDVEAKLIALICSDPPEGRKRWTLQLLADKLVELKILDSISDVAVMKCLKKMNLSLGE